MFRKNFFSLILILLLSFLISCGQTPGGGGNPGGGGGGGNPPSGGSDPGYVYEDNGLRYTKANTPVVFYVNKDKYKKHKASFDKTEESYRSKSGKQLVKFEPRDGNPKFSTINETSRLWTEKGERWVMFREDESEFTDLDGAAGVCLYSWNQNNELVYGEIVIDDNTVTKGYYFQQVLLHEMGHALGFSHTFEDDYSLMNYNYSYKTDGLTYLDIQRTHEKYPFSMVGTYIKDLEKIAALKESEHRKNYENYIIENYGLSEGRANEVAKVVLGYKKLKSKRSLTQRDKNILTEKLLGFDYETGKNALAKVISGEKSDEVEELFKKAADKNNIEPEHVKELVAEVFLQ